MTSLWVLRTVKHAGVMRAETVISAETAEIAADLMHKEGHALEAAMRKAGILQGEKGEAELDVDKLEIYTCKHGVVLQGPLTNSMWPRVRRRLQLPMPSILCTCMEFLQHADCEHLVFTKALEGDSTIDLGGCLGNWQQLQT